MTPEILEIIKKVSLISYLILQPIGILFGFLSIWYDCRKKGKKK